MFNKILVPVDGSELAEQALEPALALVAQEAVAQGAGQIILLRVLQFDSIMMAAHAEYGVIAPIEPSLEQARSEAENYLQGLAERYERPSITLTPLLAEGDVAGTIVDTAVAHDVDLIGMSTHGYSGVTRWLMGSVAEKVVRAASHPVLVVRAAAPIDKMVITLDGSELAERALEPGLAVAASLDAAVCLLRVEPETMVNPLEYAALEQAASGLGQQLQDSATTNAKNYLAGAAEKLAKKGVEVATAVRQGPAAKNILDFAEEEGVDLIVMATHGRTGLRRWVYGSVAERVLHGAQCDCAMLIVRVPDAALR
ncbi:MAG: universal stress protein [Chloroflexi bacterium]|nr:universal stress protein [Chloroflexota bacterium]